MFGAATSWRKCCRLTPLRNWPQSPARRLRVALAALSKFFYFFFLFIFYFFFIFFILFFNFF